MSPVRDRVVAWPALVRLLHWSLAAAVIFNLVRDDGGQAHRWVGYAAVGVVVVRLLRARWRPEEPTSHLRPSMRATLAYLRGRAPRQPGHDPLGLWMVWLLWTLVLLLGLTGWMSQWDMFWGDEVVNGLHTWLANGLMVAVAVHLLGVAGMSWHWRENLPGAMLSGRKRRVE